MKPTPKKEPITLKFLFERPAHFFALGFGSGLLPVMPGTWGSLLAIPIALFLFSFHDPMLYLSITVALLVAGTIDAHITGKSLNEPDHSSIVIDEIVALVFLLFFTDGSWLQIAVASCLFRVFDVLKPPPISTVDRLMQNGIGVMLDDLLAAAYALAVLVFLVYMRSLFI
jgi:phosphatidylglycerophosphatase A